MENQKIPVTWQSKQTPPKPDYAQEYLVRFDERSWGIATYKKVGLPSESQWVSDFGGIITNEITHWAYPPDLVV